MIVTLDVFSGRPNPSWKLSSKDAKSFLERFARKSVAAADQADNVLGYRGTVVSASSDEALPDGLQSDFRVGGNSTADAATADAKRPFLSADEADDAVLWLLSKGQHAVNEDVFSHVKDAIESRRGISDQHPTEMADDTAVNESNRDQAAAAACIIANTAYNPGFWNVPAVQPHNNCYNYAMNFKSNTFAQPGRITGHMYTAFTCASVGNAAAWDGCKNTCSGSNKNVALVIWPSNDFHWYRKNAEGFWSHKPGGTAVRNTDNAGVLINGTSKTPFNCNRGPYTVFCGYLFSPTGMQVK